MHFVIEHIHQVPDLGAALVFATGRDLNQNSTSPVLASVNQRGIFHRGQVH